MELFIILFLQTGRSYGAFYYVPFLMRIVMPNSFRHLAHAGLQTGRLTKLHCLPSYNALSFRPRGEIFCLLKFSSSSKTTAKSKPYILNHLTYTFPLCRKQVKTIFICFRRNLIFFQGRRYIAPAIISTSSHLY